MIPKVSVIVPIYGVENYINKCAQSLLEQTLDGIEYIFINDCTPDKSMDILQKMIENYPERKDFVKIINMSNNGGQALVRRIGVEAATGEYVINCDSDDWIDKGAYELLYDCAKNNSYDMLFFDYFVTDGIVNMPISKNTNWNSSNSLIGEILSGRIKGSLCFTLIKRELFNNQLFTFPKFNMTEDSTTLIQLLYLSKKIGHLNNCLYYYYTNPDSITRLISKDKCFTRFNDCFGNTKLLELFFSRLKIYGYENEMLMKQMDCISLLNPCLYSFKYYKIWKNAFPDLHVKILKTNSIPLKMKFKHFITYLGLYPIWHLLKGYSFAK